MSDWVYLQTQDRANILLKSSPDIQENFNFVFISQALANTIRMVIINTTTFVGPRKEADVLFSSEDPVY